MSIIDLWIFGSLGLLAVALLWHVVRVLLPPRLPRVGEGACARCRYPVRGLGDWKCPECGTDLRVGGILTPELRHRSRAHLAGGVVAWALLMIVAGMFTAQLTVPRMIERVATQSSISQRVVDLGSRSGAYRSFQILETTSVTAEGWGSPKLSMRVEGVGELTIGERGLTGEQLLDWMEEHGVDTGRQIVRAEAAEAARIFDQVRGGTAMISSGVFWSISSSTSTRAVGPVITRWVINPWIYAIAGMWLIVSAGGLWWLVWWRRRLRRAAVGSTRTGS